jgi:SAM-dependent methyltransferase
MRSEMARIGVPDGVQIVAGYGEQLPLQKSSLDVAWLSAVVHHIDDLSLCIHELRRVLTADGIVFVRGLFSDRGEPARSRLLPGWEQARRAFPATGALVAAFARDDFELVAARNVEDAGPSTLGEAADRIRRSRHVDSLLRRFTDAQIEDGLAAMARRDPGEPLAPTTLGLLTFRAR